MEYTDPVPPIVNAVEFVPPIVMVDAFVVSMLLHCSGALTVINDAFVGPICKVPDAPVVSSEFARRPVMLTEVAFVPPIVRISELRTIDPVLLVPVAELVTINVNAPAAAFELTVKVPLNPLVLNPEAVKIGRAHV